MLKTPDWPHQEFFPRRLFKKAAILRQGYGRQASGVLVQLSLLTYYEYAPRANYPAAFPSTSSGQDWTDLFEQHPFYLTLKNVGV